jgi:protein SCO1/2
MSPLLRQLGVLVAAACLALLLAACGSGASSDNKPKDLTDKTGTSKYSGTPLTPPLPRPNFTLTNTTGAQYSFGTATAGHPTLLFFGYTNCPDVCPFTMADIANALKKVPDSVRKKVDVVFVTTDVKHDNPAAIASWLRHFDSEMPHPFVGLTGTQDQVDAAQAAAHVILAEEDGRTHSARVTLYGTDDYARVSFAQGTDLQEQLTHDLML